MQGKLKQPKSFPSRTLLNKTSASSAISRLSNVEAVAHLDVPCSRWKVIIDHCHELQNIVVKRTHKTSPEGLIKRLTILCQVRRYRLAP